MTHAGVDHDVRAVADAILYEGYLLYPYRANSGKNQSRWQFGVLGPPGASELGVGEQSGMSAQAVVAADAGDLRVTLRFLHLQRRTVQRRIDPDGWESVHHVTSGDHEWISWDEASECEIESGPYRLTDLGEGRSLAFEVPAFSEIEPILDATGASIGRIVRTRAALSGLVDLRAASGRPDQVVLSMDVRNTTAIVAVDKHSAPAYSMLGAHVIMQCDTPSFVSLFSVNDEQTHEYPLIQDRCYPVLAGTPNPALPDRSTTVLVSPIILYDFPVIAGQSEGSLFDSTEIDEILSLRILTMTDEEKAQARATDPKAAEIIDRCEALTPEGFADLHGVLRDPHAGQEDAQGNSAPMLPEVPDGVDWWSPEADTRVSPRIDGILVGGVRIAGGSTVRVHPSRRADAQDLFFDGKLARVATIHEDVDGDIHVGVTLLDDPAADLHNWYGRYLYFAPDEVEPVPGAQTQSNREENTL
ncbi:hypothetical protein EEB13_18745 [Rhodococcus sp. WS3]|uniref:hypothetical protein n=1 Tax=Rhodococcus sp. WS3 TaxID=2486271 RepID=UPI0011436300|nr:hypothetical protein [Rhodococcus sp. WS3]ROZ46242.1 hypothetical protein EEB13_18745 [Rhodococcus sp. WS3]